jgi:O-antigen ligase
VEQASAERRQLWRAAAYLIREAPLAGPGYHRYYDAIQHDPVFRVPSLIGDFGRAVDNPHNLYLTAAVSGGIPALGLLLAAAVVLLRLAGRRLLDMRATPAVRGLAAALLAYWIGFFLSGLVGRNVFIVNESLSWHAVAALTAAATLSRRAA